MTSPPARITAHSLSRSSPRLPSVQVSSGCCFTVVTSSMLVYRNKNAHVRFWPIFELTNVMIRCPIHEKECLTRVNVRPRPDLLGRKFRYSGWNGEATFRADFTGRFAPENTTRVVVVIELGARDALHAVGSHVDFGGRQHADTGGQ